MDDSTSMSKQVLPVLCLVLLLTIAMGLLMDKVTQEPESGNLVLLNQEVLLFAKLNATGLQVWNK